MIIAIDGPAGSGKSTVAKLVAEKLGFHYLDTGAMYRAVAYRALEQAIPLDDEAPVLSIAESEEISFSHEDGEALPSRVFIGRYEVTSQIRTPLVDDAVSAVARLPRVREAMVRQQRHLGQSSDIVVEGRDIGTVVFPDAELKVFLTADAEERARRRAHERRDNGEAVDADEVLVAMERRDQADSTREVSPLTPAPDAWELDTTGLSIDEVVDRICDRARGIRT